MAREGAHTTSHLWLAAGTGLLGVSLGAGAILLGQRGAPVARVAPVPAVVAPTRPVAAVGAPLEPVLEVAPPLAQSSMVDAINRTRDAVVNIEAAGILGAGVIVHDSGVVLTNHHVIEKALRTPDRRSGATVVARFEDGRELPATVLVADAVEDLALLRLSPPDSEERFEAVALGHSASLNLGQDVFAIGNPVGLNHSVSRGIVSALDRTEVIPNRKVPLIQLDASVNLGNSGGPLFDFEGALVGIVTMRTERAEGIAFAVPVDHIRAFLDTVRDPDEPRGTGEVGLRIAADASDEDAKRLGYGVGLRVQQVLEGSTAAAAGLVEGDLIVGLRGKRLDGLDLPRGPLALPEHLVKTVRSLLPGERLPMSLVRDGAVEEIDVEIGETPRRRQAIIDAEELLGLELERDKEQPTIRAIAHERSTLGATFDLRGAEIVYLLDAPTDSMETFGAKLLQLQATVRATARPLWVRIGLRRSGDERVWPLMLKVQ